MLGIRQKRSFSDDITCRSYSLHIGNHDAAFRTGGLPAADLMNLCYAPFIGYWRAGQETADKLVPRSFPILGAVVRAKLRTLDDREVHNETEILRSRP